MDREILAADLPATAAELREQLSLMTAVSQLLEESADSRALGCIASLNRSVCRMLRIINRMELAHRLTDEHELRLCSSSLDLSPWAEELARKIHGVLRTAGITLEWELPDRLPFFGDRELLELAVTELVSAAAEGGDRLCLSLSHRKDSVHITVTAEGDPRRQALLPEEAERREDPGLSNARLVAQLHGGVLVTGLEGGLCRTLTMVLPVRPASADSRLSTPGRAAIPTPGFDPILVAFSHLLPESEFLSDL